MAGPAGEAARTPSIVIFIRGLVGESAKALHRNKSSHAVHTLIGRLHRDTVGGPLSNAHPHPITSARRCCAVSTSHWSVSARSSRALSGFTRRICSASRLNRLLRSRAHPRRRAQRDAADSVRVQAPCWLDNMAKCCPKAMDQQLKARQHG